MEGGGEGAVSTLSFQDCEGLIELVAPLRLGAPVHFSRARGILAHGKVVNGKKLHSALGRAKRIRSRRTLLFPVLSLPLALPPFARTYAGEALESKPERPPTRHRALADAAPDRRPSGQE